MEVVTPQHLSPLCKKDKFPCSRAHFRFTKGQLDMKEKHPNANLSQITRDRQLVQAFLHNPAGQGRLLQFELQQGIEKGVYKAEKEWATTIGTTQKEDIVSTAITKALSAIQRWKGTSSLQTWAHRIAYNTTIDSLRKHKNDPLHKAISIQNSSEPKPGVCTESKVQTSTSWNAKNPSTPEEDLIVQRQNERIPFIHQIVEDWPEPERSLGRYILSGEARSISAAAHLVKKKQGHTIYPAKAKQALQARRKELESFGIQGYLEV